MDQPCRAFERYEVDAGSVKAKPEPKQRDEESRNHDQPAVVKAVCRSGGSIVHGPELDRFTERALAVIGPDPLTESDFGDSDGC